MSSLNVKSEAWTRRVENMVERLSAQAARLDLRAEEMSAYSIVRAIECGATGKTLSGSFEAEINADLQRIHPATTTNSMVIPFWALHRRDLTVANASAGGYLVSGETPEALDTLRPWSVAARAGITVLPNLVGNQLIPKTNTNISGGWLSTEATALTESQPAVGQLAMVPKTAGAFLEFSRQLSIQANAEMFARRELSRTVGTLVDQAIINGSGAAGQPQGILNTAGIATQSGATLGLAGVANMKQQVADANAPDAGIAFLATNPVRELLEVRERASGSGFVWDNDRVASLPAFTSTVVPAATMLCGYWPDVFLGLWGPGLEFQVNPYDQTGFRAGIIQARVLVSCDVAVAHPAAFCVSSSIT